MAYSRRRFMQQAGLAGGLAASGFGAGAFGQQKADAKFLIVLCGTGGCSLVDSFMTVRESESANPKTVNAYPDAMVQQIGAFRCMDMSARAIGAIPAPFTANQSNFVKKHSADMMVVTRTGTSVNHGVAEYRSVNGNAAWKGRTLQEAVANQYGAGRPIPNVHLVNGLTFTDRGTDTTLPGYAIGEQVPAPNLWPLSLDGQKGVKGAPSRELFEAARKLRNEGLDPESDFMQAFGKSGRIRSWNEIRQGPLRGIEAADLITKLMLFKDSAQMPLTAYGLKSSELGQKVRDVFPAYEYDPLESQAALAFLLIRYGIAVTVTLGPDNSAVFNKGLALADGGGLGSGDILNPPISFDFSHQAHREVQALMWSRILNVADRLIGLLKSEEYAGGQSYWDRSMIYVATEFGRSKNRPEGAMTFGSGHDLNNGALIVSPMANGGKVLGGVDPNTILTYGFDPRTGAPDKGRTMTEAEIYAGIVQAMGLDTAGSGLPDIRAMRKVA